MIKSLSLFCVWVVWTAPLWAQPIKPLYPLPTKSQLAWHQLEFYLFAHFGPNTFTDLEWGKGTEKEEVFNPTHLDCGQWARIAKASGAKGIILTAKHHDGYCLWPSAYSKHTVRQSKWRDGKGDVLQELAAACKRNGLKLGIYLSPWDRNHPAYGTAEYNRVFVAMMQEVVTKYGPLFEFWWDGANGEGPNGKKQVYDFRKFELTMRRFAPRTVIFSDIGPDIRWVGNENGIAGRTNWDLLDTAGFSRGAGAPSADTLNRGNEQGKHWIPAECDVSIRPGWFYHKSEDSLVKTPAELFAIYLKSVGRGANLLLNVPPDPSGLFSPFDSAALLGFKALVDRNFQTPLANLPGVVISNSESSKNILALTDHDDKTFISLGTDYRNRWIEIKFPELVTLNCILLQEPIQMGQRVIGFSIQIAKADGTVFEIRPTTIGHKRIITFPSQLARSIRFTVTDSKAVPLISEFNAYRIDEALVERN
jgi:alpha-L-fucosidase